MRKQGLNLARNADRRELNKCGNFSPPDTFDGYSNYEHIALP